MIWSIIVGGLIGLVAGNFTKKRGSMGIVANVLAGLVGSSVGQFFLGSWGPRLADMALIPSVFRCRSCSSSRILHYLARRLKQSIGNTNINRV